MSQLASEKKRAIIVMIIAVVMVITCLPVVSEGNDAAEPDQSYGASESFSWKEVEAVCKELTGETVEEILAEILESEYGYEFYLSEPYFEGEMVTRRDVSTSSNIYCIEDHVSAYVEFGSVASIYGYLPEPGTYQRADGEDPMDFINRVFMEYASKNPREVTIDELFCVYVDLDITRKVDTSSGELMSTDVFGKLFVVEYERSDMNIITEGDDDDIKSMTISYNPEETSSNFYLSVDAGLKYEGMKIISSEDSWTIHPKITSHVNHIFVSSDMANGLWSMIAQMAGIDDRVKSKIPDLILNIIGSGSRVLDLVETIKSLTGTGMKDIDFIADINASNSKDDEGRQYVNLDIQVEGGSILFKFPISSYSISIDDVLAIIPSDVLSDDTKAIISIAATVLGCDTFTVEAMDKEMEKKYESVYDHTNTMIKYDEEYELHIPTEYIFMSAIGLIGCLVAVFMIRRQV